MAVVAIAIGAAVVGGAIAAQGASSGRRAQKKSDRRLRKARDRVKPKNILKLQKALVPQFRQSQAFQFGPQLNQTIERQIANLNLEDTNLASGFRVGAAVAPEINAFNLAMEKATQIRTLQAQLDIGGEVKPTESPVTAGVLGAASAFFGAGAGVKPPGTAPGVTAVPGSTSLTPGGGGQQFVNNNPIPSFGSQFPGISGGSNPQDKFDFNAPVRF